MKCEFYFCILSSLDNKLLAIPIGYTKTFIFLKIVAVSGNFPETGMPSWIANYTVVCTHASSYSAYIQMHQSERVKNTYMLSGEHPELEQRTIVREKHYSLVWYICYYGIYCFPNYSSTHTNLLLAECEVRTASYGPSFFLPFGPRAKCTRHENKEGKKRGSITCRTDRANEANKMFIIWLCWLFQLEVRTATYGPGIDQSQHAI